MLDDIHACLTNTLSVNVISSERDVRFTMVPLKTLSDQVLIRFQCLSLLLDLRF